MKSFSFLLLTLLVGSSLANTCPPNSELHSKCVDGFEMLPPSICYCNAGFTPKAGVTCDVTHEAPDGTVTCCKQVTNEIPSDWCQADTPVTTKPGGSSATGLDYKTFTFLSASAAGVLALL